MPDNHPNCQQGIIGTGELVWKDRDGKPTLDIAQRAWADTIGNLMSPGTKGARPTPALGHKIDLLNTNGTSSIGRNGRPGWTTYGKEYDAKYVFIGRKYPQLFPKVAATIRNIRGTTKLTLYQKSEEFLKTLQSEPEKLGTYLLANITHHLEKWLKKNPDFSLDSDGISLDVLDRIGGESKPGIRIKQGTKIYKIVTSSAYPRSNGRHAWSIYIDITDSLTGDISFAQNFKLIPVGDSLFEAKICLAIPNYTPLSRENIQLLAGINTLLESLTKPIKI